MGSGTNRGIHWYARKRVCIPKKEGDLGFTDLKQVWRIMQNRNCLVGRILRAHYLLDGGILKATLKNKSFYVRKSIMHEKEE